MRNIIFLLIFLMLFSCQKEIKFQQTASGIQYAFLKRNTKAPKPQQGDAMILDVDIYWRDSLIFSSSEMPDAFVLPVEKPKCDGCIDEALHMLHQGDSAIFKIDAQKFYTYDVPQTPMPKFIRPGDKLTFYIKLVRILTQQELKKQQQRLEKMQKLREIELLNQYLEENNITQNPTKSGLYYLIQRKGYGDKPKIGDSVYFKYTAMLINGEVIDQTKKDRIFRAKLGDTILYKGVQEGLLLMSEGEKARLIIPSDLALGKKGIPNVVPPYSTIIFDIELVKVKSKK